MSRRVERLHSGLYECDDCAARYEVEDSPEDDLYCDCGGSLVPIEDEAEDAQCEDSE